MILQKKSTYFFTCCKNNNIFDNDIAKKIADQNFFRCYKM